MRARFLLLLCSCDPEVGCGFNDGKPHLFAMHRVLGFIELRIDGVTDTLTPFLPVDVSAPGRVAYMGSNANGDVQRLDGDVAEVIAVKGAIDKAQMESIEAALKKKYAIP